MNKTEKYKQSLLNKLYAPYEKCKACPLGSLGRKNIVFGDGNPDASLMFIGEAPGYQEDLEGKPFVGRSGKLLDTVFGIVGINRSDVFITNIIKCRPPNNRKPTMSEMSTCKKLLLLNQIKIIRPKVICTLGASAIEGLLGHQVKITHLRGKETQYENIPLIPTYHPAYILRNPPQLKTLVEDIKKAFTLASKVN